MPEQFDPYHQWLGISPKDQPPNHYRLLGIDLFEAEPDVISNAADQRMVHVRSFQAGENSDLSQTILNEISSAKICLLNSAKKLAYDDQLRRKIQASLPVARPLEVAPLQAPPLPEANPNAFDFLDSAPTLHKENVKKNPRQLPLALAAVVVGVFLFAGIVWMNQSKGTSESETEMASNPIDVPKPPPPLKPEPESQPKHVPQPEPKGEPKPEPELLLEPQAEPQPEPESKPKEKLPVPDPAAQQKSLATIRDIYQGEDRTALARKLFGVAKETRDATDRFVLLQEAKDVASKTWQGELAFEVIGAMVGEYDISGLEMKAGVLEEAAKRPRLTSEQKTGIANAALKVMDEAVDDDNFEVAQKLGSQASQLLGSSKLFKDKELFQILEAKNTEVEAAAKAYADALEAMPALKEKPTDPGANLLVGKYHCFNKLDWETGLPMLALGGDDVLKKIAELDLAEPKESGAQASVGDAWWDFVEKADASAKSAAQQRARHWYELAVPGLSGLLKAKLEKRLRLLPEADGGAARTRPSLAVATSNENTSKIVEFYAIAIIGDGSVLWSDIVQGTRVEAYDTLTEKEREWRADNTGHPIRTITRMEKENTHAEAAEQIATWNKSAQIGALNAKKRQAFGDRSAKRAAEEQRARAAEQQRARNAGR